jgi:cation diffusion facilitator family transporter
VLTVLKLGVAILSGSVGVFSEGIHSFLDLISASVSFFSVRVAGKPADEDHPYGHGRIETLSSLFEALLLVAAAAWITYEGVDHLRHPHPIEYQGLAIAVIALSIVVSYFVYRHNRSVAAETDSSALHVNALHFLSDVVASLAILMGLVVLALTHWQPIDPIMAFLVAAYILAISVNQVKKALLELSDVQLPEHEIEVIRGALGPFGGKNGVIEAHDLRTRKSGANRHIDFHLVVCRYMTVHESHAVCDEIEASLEKALPRTSASIHVEPCELEITNCNNGCPIYTKRTK